jgi:cobalt-zinc-cadmium efflux system membrane fusion protein
VLLLAASCGVSHAAPPTAPNDGSIPVSRVGSESPIRVATVSEQEIARSLRTGARVTFDDLYVSHVLSPVNGRVSAILAPLGAHVRKGDALATINSPDLATALADQDKAHADLIATHHQLQRASELYHAHAGSQRDFESAQDEERKARAELARAQEKVRLLSSRGGNRVTQDFVLLSPIDGEVISRTVTPGMEVQGQLTGGSTPELFTIGRLDPVWVLADVYEQDLARVHLGANARVTLVAYPDRIFQGTIDWISGAVEPATRTTKVRLTIANPDRLLKPDMYATAQIDVPGRHTLAIPRSALLHMADKTIVYVVGQDSSGQSVYQRRPVIVDESEPGSWVPVLHGLKAGERIVTTGAILLSEVSS